MSMPTNLDLKFDHENLTICENLGLYSQIAFKCLQSFGKRYYCLLSTT